MILLCIGSGPSSELFCTIISIVRIAIFNVFRIINGDLEFLYYFIQNTLELSDT